MQNPTERDQNFSSIFVQISLHPDTRITDEAAERRNNNRLLLASPRRNHLYIRYLFSVRPLTGLIARPTSAALPPLGCKPLNATGIRGRFIYA